ncbi:DUF659 domain-containing protein [Heracleum sosnowskyi]|uniref:DUF659 domain-containing protein n=1 Tax=Heracleum sosnowskyi TaxID=360622 RepID=A0AAD8NDT6_9APIA|nr:DUF659 domain-containing protein [Heracleum sosnowskyi]
MRRSGTGQELWLLEKRSKRPVVEEQQPIQENEDFHEEDEYEEEAHPSEKRIRLDDEEKSNQILKPLLSEVEICAKADGKNPGGSKVWICKHCKHKHTSSYTRIHAHFLGSPPGKKPQITRCPVMLTNRVLLQRIRKMVEDAEEQGVVSPALTRSTINNSQKASPNEKSIADSFKLIERHSVDLLVEKALCANSIPFNVLRSPDFIAMIKGVNHAPKDYKPPSYDKDRTSLLDECKREIEKNLAPMKDTWFVTYIKDKPLINVIAANSHGSMFLYAENFEEKLRKAITTFLLKAVEEIGPSNVLKIVTNNAANCKLAGKEIEKDFVTKFSSIEDTHKMAKDVIKFFKNHGTTLELFRANSALELLKVAKTRFASHYILLRRISKCREALATSVVLMAEKL